MIRLILPRRNSGRSKLWPERHIGRETITAIFRFEPEMLRLPQPKCLALHLLVANLQDTSQVEHKVLRRPNCRASQRYSKLRTNRFLGQQAPLH